MMKLSSCNLTRYAHVHDLLLTALIGLLVVSSCQVLVATAMFLSIDCGASDSGSYTDEKSIKWVGDEGYVHSGKSQTVAFDVPRVLSTLRVFSTLRKNCYTVPVATGDRILVRATFYYGNYDGTNSPPSFDLYFDANYWTNVNVSGSSAIYNDYEVIYSVKKNTTSICLAQTLAHQIPFISSLEFRSLGPDMYTLVGSDVALFKTVRIASGKYRRTTRYPEDRYDRIWYSGYGINAYQVSQATSIDVSGAVDEPPEVVLQNATTAGNTSQYYQFFTYIQQDYEVPVYITTYFSEVFRFSTSSSYKRSFQIYVDNNPYDSEEIIPPFGGVKEVTITNITASSRTGFYLVPTSDATLPVLINAFEVYTLSDPLSSGTHIADVEGLMVLQLQFEVLIIWSGDPCLPSQSQWEWVQCSTGSIPRIISLNLSSFGLIGLLPDFSSMDALVTIDLHDNSLTGPIPGFLGSFPNLKKLDLSDNRFSGTIPLSLSGNKNLSLVVSGNCLAGMSCPPPPKVTPPPPASPNTPPDDDSSPSTLTPPGEYYFGSTGNKNTALLSTMLLLLLGGAVQALHCFS